jgi:alpha-mannosidase
LGIYNGAFVCSFNNKEELTLSGIEITIVETKETIFFKRKGDALRQWIIVTVESRSARPVKGTVAIDAGGEEVVTQLDILPGVREYRCYAATLWPHHPPAIEAPVHLIVEGHTITATVSVGTYRPWTVYLLSDVCTDYTWVYESVEEVHADDAAITKAEIALAEETAGSPEPNCNHYNFVHAREVEFFLDCYPHQAQKLFDHIGQGTITLNPIFNMCLTGNMSLEELIRQFYPARSWARQYGLDICCANHQETPTITWAMATVLAQSGIDHLVKSILPYECPWAERLEEPPLFRWEGPDGSHVMVRQRNEDYVEGNFVLRGLRATNTALHDEIIPRYEQLGGKYPFDAIALVGCYGDLSPHSRELGAKKVATVTAYNAQEWEYPKLINASHKQFWEDVETQVAAREVQVPVYRGDYGAAWEVWPASLARDFAAWRRAQERARSADAVAALTTAILSHLDREWHDAHRQRLAEGWTNLTYLADHAWNGANDANRALNASLRRQWQTTANQAFDEVVTGGLKALSRYISTGEEDRVMVFNSLGWRRTGLVEATDIQPDSGVVDLTTGESMPTQAVEVDGQKTLWFEARDVPSVGYRVFGLQPATDQRRPEGWDWEIGVHRLEGPFYAVEVSPVTGGIVSLYDKVRDKELADPESPYHLNQCLYFSEEVEHTPQTATVEIGPCGPLFGQLIVRSTLKNTRVTTTITLYTNLDRVDIRNEVDKVPTAEKQELDFAFPFQVPDRQYRFEAPGAIITPGADQRPGAGQAVTAVRHFVDVFNDEFGVTLSQADSGLVEFGHRTTTEDPLGPDPNNSTVVALALENCIDWHEATRDQAGARHFVFRYSLRGHRGKFDPTAAVRFGWEDNNELLAMHVPGGQKGDIPSSLRSSLPSDSHSFLEVTPDNVVLTHLKVAEEDGLIARLWECDGRDTSATVKTSGLGSLLLARRTNLLEQNDEVLDVADEKVTIPVRARGLATMRLTFK